MNVVPRIRWVVARHPLLYWAVVAVVAAGVAAVVATSLRGVEQARSSWGRTTTVWVAAASFEPGDRILVEARTYPLAVVPPSALADPPGDRIAVHPVAAGEIVLARDVSTAGVAGLVPDGSVALAVPAPRAAHLEIGARVTAFAEGRVVGHGLVVAADEDQVVVAVAAGEAASMSLAIAAGSVVVGLNGE